MFISLYHMISCFLFEFKDVMFLLRLRNATVKCMLVTIVKACT